jgi:hypothetical protein
MSQRTIDTFFKPATATNVSSLPNAVSKSTEQVTVTGLTNCNVFCFFADACLCPNFQFPESDRVTWRAHLFPPTIYSPPHRPRSPRTLSVSSSCHWNAKSYRKMCMPCKLCSHGVGYMQRHFQKLNPNSETFNLPQGSALTHQERIC